MREAYEAGSREHGFEPGIGQSCPTATLPPVCFVADDVDHAWDEIGTHLLHDARMYAPVEPGQRPHRQGVSDARSVAELRESSASHRIYSRERKRST